MLALLGQLNALDLQARNKVATEIMHQSQEQTETELGVDSAEYAQFKLGNAAATRAQKITTSTTAGKKKDGSIFGGFIAGCIMKSVFRYLYDCYGFAVFIYNSRIWNRQTTLIEQ